MGVAAWALTISLILAAIEVGRGIWWMFFRKAKLEAKVDWGYRDSQLQGLSFFIANTGHRKTVIAEIGLQKSDDESPQHFSSTTKVWEELPLVLDVDEATPRLHLPVKLEEKHKVEGVVVIDHNGVRHVFAPPEEPNPNDPMFKLP